MSDSERSAVPQPIGRSVKFGRFRPAWYCPGGHLQTIAAVRPQRLPLMHGRLHRLPTDDGDAIHLHEDVPRDEVDSGGNVLLIHGLTGCHAASYMVRLSERMTERGNRVFRMDMRGCGSGFADATTITHAGRSDDVSLAIGWIAHQHAGPIAVVGFSLGGNQTLRMLGRIGTDDSPRPAWMDRLRCAAVVSPPIDLRACSLAMNRVSRRIYTRYFLRGLLRRVPPKLVDSPIVRDAFGGQPMRTLWELDDRLTAPLAGFRDAEDYYDQCSAASVVRHNAVPTLVLAAADDPIVPASCLSPVNGGRWPGTTRLLMQPHGGHLGFWECGNRVWSPPRCWMDGVLERYLSTHLGSGSISSATGLP